MPNAKSKEVRAALILIVLFAGLFNAGWPLRADDSGLVVGAIRWDVWVGDLDYTDTKDGVWNELALSPAQFHDRLPFYSQILGANSIQARYQSEGVHNRTMPVGGWEDQAVMDAEIEAAAGTLDYWAFLDYPDWASEWSLHTHLALYLASSVKSKIHFSIMMGYDGQWWTATRMPVYMGYLAEPSYQKIVVAGESRPLVFIAGPATWWAYPVTGTADVQWAAIQQRLVAFTNASVAQGSGKPYYVLLGAAADMSVAADKLAAPEHGTPAISQYSGTDSSFLSTGKQLVPCMHVGWDGTPRKDLWDSTGGAQGAPGWGSYGTRAAKLGPKDLAAQVKSSLIDYTTTNAAYCESRTTLLYAWNEFSEGGWLCPTYYDGNDRLRALRDMRNVRADYRFNNDGQDLSAAHATLTLNNGATFGPGRNGTGLLLDGVDDYASAPDNDTFDTGLNQLSVACWVNLAGLPAAGTYAFPVDKDWSYRIVVDSTGAADFAVVTANNAWYSTGTVVNFGTLATNTWYHLAATYDGHNLRAYVNGTLAATTTAAISGAISPSTTPLMVGRSYGTAGYLKGTVDEIAIWKTAMSTSEVNRLYQDGFLAGYWPFSSFDEYGVSGYPQYCHDASRNDNVATPKGGFSSVLDSDAKVGQAIAFNGTTGYATVTDAPPLKGMGQLTVMCWARRAATSPSSTAYLLSKDGSYQISMTSAGVLSMAIATANNAWGASGTTASLGTLPANTWCHVAFVYTGSQLRTFLNGQLVAASTAPLSGNIASTTSNLCFGSSSAGTANFFNGSLDECSIYNNALTDQAILDIYNSQN